MNCPNCSLPFTEERAEKYFCSTCGWMEKVGKEWKSCSAPESQAPQGIPDPPPEPEPAAPEPEPPALEIQPAVPEPESAAQEPEPKVKELFGGLVTITEVDE